MNAADKIAQQAISGGAPIESGPAPAPALPRSSTKAGQVRVHVPKPHKITIDKMGPQNHYKPKRGF